MSIKKILGTLVVLLGVGLIAWAFGAFSNMLPFPSPGAQTQDKSPILGGTVARTNSYEYVENKQYYMVDAVYPRKTALTDSAADVKARTTMEQSIAADIAQFKTDGNFANLTAEDIRIQGLGAERKYVMGFEYKEYKGTNSVSYVFTVYEDTLGAHPNGFYKTFTFDTQGNELTLASLFKPGARYLDKLSVMAYADVVKQLTSREGATPGADELDTVRMGTAPSPEALQFFYIDGTNLHLLFPPYQVAAYAAGSFDVSIPLSSLSTILK